MDATGKLTVFFEDPFWVGVCECRSDGMLKAARVVFGAEPKDAEVYGYFLENWNRLRFSPAVAGARDCERRINPKRARREASRQTVPAGIGTKAQQALSFQREQAAAARKSARRGRALEEQERRFELRQQKKKDRRRGG